MKKHIQKAQDLASTNKQMTFDVPDVPQTEEKKKTKSGKPISTYWICVDGHVFEHKYRVHQDRLEKMSCPICGKKIKNKSTKTTYLYYLNKKGRGDVKKYRANEIKKEKKAMEKKVLFDKREQEYDV